jgi:hypothetical protein
VDVASDCWKGLVRTLLREDVRYLVVIHAYFDESEIRGGPCPVIGMAGLLYDADRALALEAKLKDLYELHQIPYFHSATCESGAPPFDHLHRDVRTNLRNKIIDYIHEFTAFGFSRCLPIKDFDETFGAKGVEWSAYETCLWSCIGGVIGWAGDTGYTGRVAYFFEAGAKHQDEVARLMKRLYEHPELKENHVYAAHTFAEKKLHRPLHTADLFAWEATHAAVCGFTGKGPMRKEYVRLVRGMHCEHTLMGRRELESMAPGFARATLRPPDF